MVKLYRIDSLLRRALLAVLLRHLYYPNRLIARGHSMKETIQSGHYHCLRHLSVTGGFLDGLQLDLSAGLNCVIGARGTGKTTVLEFMRYALDAMPNEPAAYKRIINLIEGNLIGGRIEIAIQTRDGLEYIISRTSGEEPVILDVNRQPTELSLRGGGLFSIDVFSQNEIEAVADQPGCQLRLIDNFQASQIAEINHQISSLVADLAANANKIAPVQQKIVIVSDQLRTLPDILEQLKAFGSEGGEDAEAINKAHQLKALRDRETRAIQSAREQLVQLYNSTESLISQTRSLGNTITKEMLSGPNSPIFTALQQSLTASRDAMARSLQDALDRIGSEGRSLDEAASRLNLQHKQQDLSFSELIDKHKEAQGKAAQRTKLERAKNELQAKETKRQQLIQQLQTLKDERQRQLESLSELRDQRFAIRKGIVKQINQSLSPSLRVSLVQFGDPSAYQQLLEDALRGNRLQQGTVARKITQNLSPAELTEIVTKKDAQTMVDKASLNPDQAEKVIAVLSGSEAMFELETVELIDRPKIELNDNETFKETADLSTGQKCTSILPILLLDSANPLLIDQPEDNLDNQFVFENIVHTIGSIKQRRQLLFVTHNPNIPVLGEADRVFVMDSDGVQARNLRAGSVDDCKQSIVTLLEGGEDAFRRRSQRYTQAI